MKRVVIIAAAAVGALQLAGCASSASGVQAVEIPASRYAGLSCAEAETALVDRRNAVADLSRRQDAAARRDTAGVALVGLPVGSIFRGNVADELAQAKGEQAALERHIAANCRV